MSSVLGGVWVVRLRPASATSIRLTLNEAFLFVTSRGTCSKPQRTFDSADCLNVAPTPGAELYVNQSSGAITHAIVHYEIVAVAGIAIHDKVIWTVKGIRMLVTSVCHKLSHCVATIDFLAIACLLGTHHQLTSTGR